MLVCKLFFFLNSEKLARDGRILAQKINFPIREIVQNYLV